MAMGSRRGYHEDTENTEDAQRRNRNEEDLSRRRAGKRG
jgi:hypothetical protein